MKVLRFLLWMLGVLLALFALVLIFISPLAKWAIETYSPDYIGRQVRMEKLGINLLTGRVRATDLLVHEVREPDTFFYTQRLFADVDVSELWHRRFRLREAALTHFWVQVIERPSGFNFDDLAALVKNEKGEKKRTSSPKPWSYRLENLALLGGSVRYTNDYYGNTVGVDSLNVQCPLIVNTNPRSAFALGFEFTSGGKVRAALQLDRQRVFYDLHLQLDTVQLQPLLPYAREYLKLGGFEGQLTWAAHLQGNAQGLTHFASGEDFYLDQLRLDDEKEQPLLAFERLHFYLDSLDLFDRRYDFHAVVLDAPYLRYDVFPKGDNLSRLLVDTLSTARSDTTGRRPNLGGRQFSNVFAYMAEYVKLATATYLESHYFADSIVINDGQLSFTDYTLNEKFTFLLTELQLRTQKFDSRSERVEFIADSKLNESGTFKAVWSVDPRDIGNMELNYRIAQLPISGFNPYTKKYVAHPFWEGMIYYEGEATIEDRYLNSKNRITIEQIQVGDKVHSPDAYRLPIKLAVVVLRNPRGDIKLKIPVRGDLSDPKYKLWGVLFKVLGNVIVKAATTPFNLLAAAFNVEEKDLKEVPFNYTQREWGKTQTRSLNAVGKVLKAKPELSLDYYQYTDTAREMELIAVQAAKQRYLASQGRDGPARADSLSMEALGITDSLFLQYLRTQVPDTNHKLRTPQERCLALIGPEVVRSQFDSLMAHRAKRFIAYLQQERGVPLSRLAPWALDSLPADLNRERPRFLLNFRLASDTTAASRAEPAPATPGE